jgi:hypothetical protein
MTITQWCWSGLIGLGLVYWLVVVVLALRALRGLVTLGGAGPPALERWPRVTMVIPARNEAATIAAAMQTKLTQDYPDLEIIVVNDRSTDETGTLIDALAREHPRIKAHHIKHLPDGWLGKVNALERGTAMASGEWLLFTDADVHLKPHAVSTAVAYCEQRGLDQLGLLPRLRPVGLLLDVTLAAFVRYVLVLARPWAVRDPRSGVGAGVGAFNLVRRSALERSAGFDSIKLDVADDVALGLTVKRAGANCELALGRDLLGVEFYPSLSAYVVGSERAAVLLEFRLLRAVLVPTLLLLLELSPFLGLWPMGVPALQFASAVAAVASLVLSIVVARAAGNALLPSLLVPVGSVICAANVFRAGVLGWLRQSLSWRGTTYPAKALIAGRRYHLSNMG